MKDYHNGPVPDEKRRCTDIFCCIILVLLCLAMLGVAIYCWTGNNFSKLATPYDADGKGCGVDYPDYPFIYFVAPDYTTLWRTVCVKTCPTGSESTLDCKINKYVSTCSKTESADTEVAVNIYPTSPLRKSICLPTSQSLQKKIASAIGSQTWEGKIITLGKVWSILLASIPIAIVLSIVFMVFIRLTAGCFVYLLLALAIAACIGLGGYLIATPSDSVAGVAMNRVFAIVFGSLLIAFGLLVLVGVCCYRKRIKLASIIVQSSARFVKQNCAISFLPFIIFVILLIFVCVWILQALGFYSMGEPIRQQKQLPFQHFKTTNFVKAMIPIHIFYLFWGVCFLIESNDFIVSGAATDWYYQRQSPFSDSFHRFKSFHLGSVAMGSFFLALFGFIRFMYELLTPQKSEQEGCMANWKKFCDCCCFLCISYIFKCFNSGAYTFIHLSGETYCTSAWQVVGARLKQPVSTAVVAFMSVLFSVLIRVAITALTVFACYLIFKNAEPYKSQVPDTTLANIIIGLLAFAISSFFVSLYSQAMESIYVCYLIDKDAGGKEDKAPEQLKQFLLQAKKEGHILVE